MFFEEYFPLEKENTICKIELRCKIVQQHTHSLRKMQLFLSFIRLPYFKPT